MMDETAINILVELAHERGMDPAGLLAVCEVESGGRLFAQVAGKAEPLIRFEGHYFYRLLGQSKRNVAVTRRLAHRSAGKIRNPLTQAGRWKLLDRAVEIDRPAALQSTSWGVGQVMGAHWRWLGYASIDALVSEARSGLRGQAELMLRYIERAGLGAALANSDWRAFARGYNGPAYASNRYDVKLARAVAHYRERLDMPDDVEPCRRHQILLLRYGSRGEAVADLQQQLHRQGFNVKVDGDFGPATHAALVAFQRRAGLEADGIAGPLTFEALERPAPAHLVE